MAEYRLHGPPGTGKTRQLAEVWVPRAVERFGPDRVAIMSLTKGAATEIASRVGSSLPANGEGQKNVGTLHALCYRGLDSPELVVEHVPDWNETHPGFALTVKNESSDTPDLESPHRGTQGDVLMAEAELLRHRMVPRERWPGHVLSFQEKWEAWKRDRCYVDFTDLIELARRDLGTAPGAPCVLIGDEHQDSSTLELALVRKWSERAEYAVLAGDSDQAIFGWRGADPRGLLEPPIPEDQNYRLTKSFRVPRAVHAVAVDWISQASYRYAVEYQPRDADGCVERADHIRYALPEETLGAVERELAEGRTTMVAASCSYMLRPLLAVMRREGTPFHNPYRPDEGEWNPLRAKRKPLINFLGPTGSGFGTSLIWTWGALDHWLDVVDPDVVLKSGARALVKRHAESESKRRERPRSLSDAEATAVFHPEALACLRASIASGRPLDWLKSNLRASKQRSWEYVFRVAEKHGARALFDPPKIAIGTVHSFKGGEDSTVFLFPDLSHAGMRSWLEWGDRRDEVIRTLYVGMTRAKERLVLCGPSSQNGVRWSLAGSHESVGR